MKRARSYSASLDIGHYPVADDGNSIWATICLIFCCAKKNRYSDGYDSDSSDFNNYIDTDSDDD